MNLTYCLLVTGPHYGTEQASSAYLFAKALLEKGHHNIPLQVCVAAALRRGVVDEQQAKEQGLLSSNMATKFELSGLGALAQAMLTCDRVVQF